MARGKKKETILTQEEKLQQAMLPVSEQPYRVPGNWCWTKVGVLSSLHRGVSYKKSDAHADKKENDCLVMRGGNIGEGYIDIDSDNVYVDLRLVNEDQLVKKNDIIIVASTGSTKVIGRAGISFADYSDVAFGAFLMVVRPNEKTVPRYMDFFFQSNLYRNRIRDLASGVNINNIRADYITDTPFPLPPLPEQQRIVDRIESLFAKLDEAKEKAQAVVDGFEDRKAAILHKAFTGELTCCKSDIHIVHITDVIKNEKNALKAGPFGSALRKDMYVSSGYKIYGQEQVINGDEDIGDYYIDEKKYKELIACKVVPGDVLISLVGTVGKVLVLSKKCQAGIINPRLIKVSLNEDTMLPLYFKYYFESGFLKSLYKRDAHGTTMDVLNMGILKKLPFPLVEIDKQKEIIRILNTVLGNEEQAKESAEQVIAQIDTMKKSILARAFRGELGTNDPSDESAEELLKRIL